MTSFQNMNYKQLQVELKTLRDQGLISQDFKLNAPKQVLLIELNRYQNHQERIQTAKNPLLIIWLVLVGLSIGVSLVLLIIELGLIAARILNSQIIQPIYQKLKQKIASCPDKLSWAKPYQTWVSKTLNLANL